jgi:hypothetical protein
VEVIRDWERNWMFPPSNASVMLIWIVMFFAFSSEMRLAVSMFEFLLTSKEKNR